MGKIPSNLVPECPLKDPDEIYSPLNLSKFCIGYSTNLRKMKIDYNTL